jgi:hypothetical protein
VRAAGKGFFSAVALFTVFHAPLEAFAYEEVQDFLTASVYELLGSYNFLLIPVFAALALFYWFSERHLEGKGKPFIALGVFFSICLLFGGSLAESGDLSLCFGSFVNVIKFLICLAGYTFLLGELLRWVSSFFQTIRPVKERAGFWSDRVFGKSYGILFLCYSPFLILSYPGNLCWDVIGQIEQVIGQSSYSAHHPLVHTLLVGGMVKLGQTLFHSYEVGLFLYLLLQTAMLIAALAATLNVLAGRGLPGAGLWTILAIYCVTPVYSNVASTALKDVPFMAFVIGYVLCAACLLESEEWLQKRGNIALFVLMHLGVILFRNNGMPLVVLTDLGILIYLLRRKAAAGCEGRAGRKVRFAVASVSAVVGAKLILILVTFALGAAPGSKGEMLSIPFQQTARYLQLYRSELDPEERAAIENVLGDVETVAAAYDPTISDPVKTLFRKDASISDIASYLGAWTRGLVKHPGSYVDAFLVHIYGWFDPAVSTAIRYEADYDVIPRAGLFASADKILIFYYRFADRFSLLGALQNVGLAAWALFFLAAYQRRTKADAALRVANLPLWISLLICMASPCFLNHPRYAFPILFTLPFLYGFTLTASREDAA